MLDGTHYFECACGSDEHTLRFTVDKNDNEIYTSIFLNQYRPWYQRCWVAIKYVFGYKCKYGHWDTWIMKNEDIDRLRGILDEILDEGPNF